MTQELFKKYRPTSLRKMVGNDNTVLALRNMLAKGRLPHTILFHGPSGCGKTTLARIVRQELQCSDLDYKELNCSANFRGIDTVRDIARNITMAPGGGPVRVWCLDEAHQMSKDAQHAALKIFEDTPKHVYFLLCTTEPQKLLATIRNRCTAMPVEPLTNEQVTKLVKRVARKEGITLADDSLEDLVDYASGSPRAALVGLEKISTIDPDEHSEALKLAVENDKEAIDLCRALIKGDGWMKIAGILRNLKGEPEAVRWSVLGYARSVLLKGKNPKAYEVICAFENHFYDSKQAGLVRACFESVFGDS